jgi:hypothetical protein
MRSAPSFLRILQKRKKAERVQISPWYYLLRLLAAGFRQKVTVSANNYHIHLTIAERSDQVSALSWERIPVAGSMMTNPVVYCLRTNELTWDKTILWQTYIMLTDLESVFRSLKSELGLRPVYHQKEERADGHLFVTVLAYQAVQVIRNKLQCKGIHLSWDSVRVRKFDLGH